MKSGLKKYTIKKDRLSDKIIDALETAFKSGDLVLGEKLPSEEKLAEQFKVSKVAVREALREMEGRGLIKKKRGMYGGNFVSAPDLKRIGDSLISCFEYGTLTEEEMVDFRQTLEPMLIGKAALMRTDADLAAMQRNIDECEKDLALGQTDVIKHIEFHVLIAKACGNRLFVAVMEAMAEIFESIAKDWQEDKSKMSRDIEYNKSFYDCILHRKVEEAENLMKAHFDLTRKFRAEDLEQQKQQENNRG